MELERFIADCRAAHAADPSHQAVREVVARAVSEPGAVLKSLGEPRRAEVQKLYHSSGLTILNVIWAPYMIEAAGAQALGVRDAVPLGRDIIHQANARVPA